MLTGEDQRGGNVVTTLNADAQRAAYEGLTELDGARGAVAALNPQTGEVLAMASAPSYDPASFAGYAADDEEAWTSLQPQNNPDNPMLNRALRETYPPGSTFKVVTAAAALENGAVDDIDDPTDTPDPYRLPDTQDLPQNYLGNDISGVGCENASLRVALQWSCNTVFASLADEVGSEEMQAMAEEFGYNEAEMDIPVRAAESVYNEPIRPQNAMAGIGQASNRATPLQMAMVASAVANDGVLMEPYMVDQLVAPNLDVVEQHEPQEMSTPMSPETAHQLQDAMETVVEEGTGTTAQIEGVTVGGKTGTAQHGANNEELPYAWFISYAMTDEGSPVAVAVVVEDGNADREQIHGSTLAAPIAQSVMEAVLNGEN
jgi:cell division protein FtsI/penicillin-binding protein 2